MTEKKALRDLIRRNHSEFAQIGKMIDIDLAMDASTQLRAVDEFLTRLKTSFENLEQHYKTAACKVFNEALDYSKTDPVLIVGTDPTTHKISIRNPSAESLDKAIRDNLNHHTIAYFLELIQENHESAKQAARAIKRHAENHAMKDQAFEWIAGNRHKFKSMDATAAELLKVVPIKFRTARLWVGEWKNLQSTGTP